MVLLIKESWGIKNQKREGLSTNFRVFEGATVAIGAAKSQAICHVSCVKTDIPVELFTSSSISVLLPLSFYFVMKRFGFLVRDSDNLYKRNCFYDAKQIGVALLTD